MTIIYNCKFTILLRVAFFNHLLSSLLQSAAGYTPIKIGKGYKSLELE